MLLAGAPASPALAHDALVASDPADGAVLETLPSQIALDFSAPISSEPGATELQVTDAAGTSLVDGEPSIDQARLTQALAGPAAGEVTVLWKVVSSDGHPISGQFAFTVEEPAPTAEPTPAETAAPTPSATATPVPAPAQPVVDDTPWVIGGMIGAGVLGALSYLVVARLRRASRGGAQ